MKVNKVFFCLLIPFVLSLFPSQSVLAGCYPLARVSGVPVAFCDVPGATTCTTGNKCCDLASECSATSSTGSGGSDIAQLGDLESVFGSVVSMALSAAGIAVLVMLVVGGFKFLSAGGDKDATSKAGKTITYAIGGLVLVLSAWIILNLLGSFLGVDFSVFKITL